MLLLDEPTSSLDLRYQYEVMELLVKVSREKNLAVAAVIHDLNLALDFADRVALLHDGHVLAEGATKEVITPERIEKAYGIRLRSIIWKTDGSYCRKNRCNSVEFCNIL